MVVPVDFSDASVNAANYAADFAIATGAEMALIHVCQFWVSTEIPAGGQFYGQLLEDANKNIAVLKEDLLNRANHKINIVIQVSVGNIIAQVKEYCETFAHAIVVMGAQETTATERIFFGSNTLTAMRSLSFPLIIVPDGTRFTGIAVAGLACDFLDAANTVRASELKLLFSQFHPQLNILHVATKKHGMLSAEEVNGVKMAEGNPGRF